MDEPTANRTRTHLSIIIMCMHVVIYSRGRSIKTTLSTQTNVSSSYGLDVLTFAEKLLENETKTISSYITAPNNQSEEAVPAFFIANTSQVENIVARQTRTSCSENKSSNSLSLLIATYLLSARAVVDPHVTRCA